MFKISNLKVEVSNNVILDNFNLDIKDGEIHVLLGPNGIGKSTICKTIMSYPGYNITNGSIYFNEEKIEHKDTTSIARAGIYMISQSPIAIEGVTNAEMLRTAIGEITDSHVDIFSFNKKLESICKQLDIPKTFIHRNINDGMSGGERKKNELLHLWMLEPQFILLDEIDSGLDVDALKVVATSLKKYHEQSNCSILLVTHNSKILDILKPDYVHVLSDKRIIKTGDKKLIDIIEKEGYNAITKASDVGDII